MTKGQWGAYCKEHMNKKSKGGKSFPLYCEPELSKYEKDFINELEDSLDEQNTTSFKRIGTSDFRLCNGRWKLDI